MQESTAAVAGGALVKAINAAEMFSPPKSVFNLPYCAWRQRSGKPERAFERGGWHAPGGKTTDASLPALFGHEIESNARSAWEMQYNIILRK
jgi:hypothetical protein